MNKEKKLQHWLEEEKPIIELPTLLKIGVVFLAMGLALALLVLPLELVIGAFFGLGSLIFICFNPYLGLLLFIIFHFLQPSMFFPALEPLHLVRVIALIAMFGWVFHMMITKDIKIVKSTQNLFILSYCFLVLGSSFFYPEYSLPFFIEGFKVFILYFLIVNIVTTRQRLYWFIWLLILMGGAASLIGAYQHLKGIGMVYALEGIVRVCGPFLDPNDYALHLIAIIPLVVCFYWNHTNVIYKSILISIFGLLIIATTFTYSRGGAVGLATVFFLLFLQLLFQRRKNRLFYLILIIITVLIALQSMPERYWQRLQTTTLTQESAISARLDAWKTGIAMIKHNPIIGIGLNTFKYQYSLYAPIGVDPNRMLVAHNMFINVGAESGVPALIFFFLIVVFTFRDIMTSWWKFRTRNDDLMTNLTQFLTISFMGFIICSIFLSVQWVPILWILFALAVVVKNISHGVS